MNDFNVQPIRPNDEESLEIIQTIYEQSFPPNERREFSDIVELIIGEPSFTLYGILNQNKQTAGFLTEWKFDDFIYLEHFAVNGQLRGGGIGRKILGSYIKQVSLPILLEVEKPEDEWSKRRISFYERLGFSLWDIPYIQPAYHKDKSPLPMLLMTIGTLDLKHTFEEVKNKLYRVVYRQE